MRDLKRLLSIIQNVEDERAFAMFRNNSGWGIAFRLKIKDNRRHGTVSRSLPDHHTLAQTCFCSALRGHMLTPSEYYSHNVAVDRHLLQLTSAAVTSSIQLTSTITSLLPLTSVATSLLPLTSAATSLLLSTSAATSLLPSKFAATSLLPSINAATSLFHIRTLSTQWISHHTLRVSNKDKTTSTAILQDFEKWHTPIPLIRRLYAPRAISHQMDKADIVKHETVSKSLSDSESQLLLTSQPHSTDMQMPKFYNSQGKRLQRKLGGIEHMYHMYTRTGGEMICLMTKIETVYLVSEFAVLKAIECLLHRHPLLRLQIVPESTKRDGPMKFLERMHLVCDFRISERKDWLKYILEEAQQPFIDPDQPLWRLRMLKSSTINNVFVDESDKYSNTSEICVASPLENKCSKHDEKEFLYQTTFLFIMHHAIMDGGYTLWIFQEFVHFIDAFTTGVDVRSVKELPLLPPCEQCFTIPDGATKNGFSNSDQSHPASHLRFCYPTSVDTILKDYNIKFSNEISTLSQQRPRNGCVTFKFDNWASKALAQASKLYKCTLHGAIVAASLLALKDLVYGESNFNKCLQIPFEYMMDFRRFCNFNPTANDVPQYPGVASFHIPIVACLSSIDRIGSSSDFWTFARTCGTFIQNDTKTQEVFKWIQDEAARYLKCPNPVLSTGKSFYVLCVSNMGICDGVLNQDVSKRVRLVDLHGHSTILTDQMPLFFVKTLSLNGRFCGNVSFCESYTSYETATKYAVLVQKYLMMFSKL